MASINTDITIELSKQTTTPIVDFVQGDNGRGLNILISDDIITKTTETIPTNINATIYVVKPSGKEVSFTADYVNKYENSNTYQVVINGSDVFANAIAEEGIAIANIVLSSDDKHITSFDIYLKVHASRALSKNIQSSTQYKNLQDILNQAESQNAKIEEYINKFNNQMKLTVNVRYGTTTPSVLPTDKNGDIYIRIK